MSTFILPEFVPIVWTKKTYNANDDQREAAWTSIQALLSAYDYVLESTNDIEQRAAVATNPGSNGVPAFPGEGLPMAVNPFRPGRGEGLVYATLGHHGIQWIGPTFVCDFSSAAYNGEVTNHMIFPHIHFRQRHS